MSFLLAKVLIDVIPVWPIAFAPMIDGLVLQTPFGVELNAVVGPVKEE